MHVLVTVPLGLVVGLVLGTLGGGGSVLAVPALVYVVGQSPQAATSTSLVVVGLTALGGLVGHHRAGQVRVGAGVAFGLAGLGGSIAGSHLNAALPGDALLVAFAVLMAIAAVAMLRRSGAGGTHGASRPGRHGRPGTGTLVTATPHSRVAAALRVVSAGTAVGLLTGLFGVGGGFVVVPALVLALRFPMPLAVGTSLVVIAINAASALVVRILAGGHVEWGVAVPFTAAGLVGVIAGTALSSRLQADRLTRGFAVLLVLVAAFMVADAALG